MPDIKGKRFVYLPEPPLEEGWADGMMEITGGETYYIAPRPDSLVVAVAPSILVGQTSKPKTNTSKTSTE
jgi:hypothetical protein